MSLSAHLLIHVRDSTERSVKNPKFYENLIFHSVPIDKQVIVLTCCFVDHIIIDWKTENRHKLIDSNMCVGRVCSILWKIAKLNSKLIKSSTSAMHSMRMARNLTRPRDQTMPRSTLKYRGSSSNWNWPNDDQVLHPIRTQLNNPLSALYIVTRLQWAKQLNSNTAIMVMCIASGRNVFNINFCL